MQAILALEDGTVFEGKSFAAAGERTGEVVFNTSMTGYQEVLTDPSHQGQMVVMTYPLIGNYGVNAADSESSQPHLEGFIVKECSKSFSNWRAEKSLPDFLRGHDIIGIEGIDTRALTRHIRLAGAMKGTISTQDMDKKRLVKKAKSASGLLGKDLVQKVTCNRSYRWEKEGRYKVVVLDFGVKHNILRQLAAASCQVVVVPAKTETEEILKMRPDGILLSNGPGDPTGVPYAAETVKKLIGKIPIFGICLGHQILGLALGGRTYKLKFGHHGGNHPVKDLKTGKVAITVQNHGFCVDMDSLGGKEIELTHINLYDHTLEGMKHTRLPAFSVQFHPEASPGPHDANGLFKKFVEMMETSFS